MPPVLLLARRQSDTRQMKGITGSLQKAAWLQPEFENLPIKWTMTPSSSLAAEEAIFLLDAITPHAMQ